MTTPASNLAFEPLCKLVRELVDESAPGAACAPGTGDALRRAQHWADRAASIFGRSISRVWAGSAAGAARDAAGAPEGVGSLVIEVVETSSGRCLALGTFPPGGPVQAITGPERSVGEAVDSSGVCLLRLLMPREMKTLPVEGEGELRLLMCLAVELFSCMVFRPERRRSEILASLTETQQRVLLLMLEDFSEREIGERLERSQHTVHDHVKAIYSTLRVGSRAELMGLWFGGAAPGSAVVVPGKGAATGQRAP